MRTLALTLLASAALLAPSGASAATIVGSLVGSLTVKTLAPVIGAGTAFTFTSGSTSGSVNQFSPVADGTAFTVGPVTATNGTSVTLSGVFGSFAGTVDTVTPNKVSNSLNFLTVLATGTFTPSGTLSAYAAGPASLTFNFLQTGGYGSAVSGTLSLASPAASAVPEPVTWGMMLAGAGLAGAALRRRRVKVAFAA